jgi:tRNA(Arg) A34 adenosine deaminase TadA
MFKDDIFPLLLENLKNSLPIEIPVSAVLEVNGKLYKVYNNNVYTTQNHINHAEILAINDALTSLHVMDFKNFDATLYSTLEPCCMCLSFASLVRVKRILYYLNDPKFGGVSRIYALNSSFTKPDILCIEREEVKNIMQNFFKDKR